jgi:NAD(P)-dependent dehydrogenase (short-subunit alcohol dehydrogenase family)
LKLKDKVCLITGAGRGLGKAMAEEFAAEGATVFANNINADDAARTCELLKSRGAKCYLYPSGVGNYDDVKKMTEFVIRNA